MDVINKNRTNAAIDMLISLVINEIAQEDRKRPSEVMGQFLASDTARMLYDEETKLWWEGPTDIVSRYREEQNMLTTGSNVPQIRFAGFTDSWEQRKLNEVGVVIDPHPSHRAPKEETGGIPFIGIGDVDEMGNINKESARPVSESVFEEHHKRYDLEIPSLGLGRVASLGKVIRLRPDIGKYAISPTMSVLQFQENVDIDYLYAFMNSAQFQMQFREKSNGSTRQSVGTEMVRLLDLAIPSDKEEQKAIGMFHKNLDILITLHQRKYDKLVNVKKSMLEKMFPRDGANVPEIRFAGFTDPWEQRKLGDIADVTKLAGFEFTEHIVYSDEGNIIALRGLNVKNGQLILDDVKYIDDSNFSKLGRSKLYIDDVLFTYVGTVGELAIIPENDRFYLAPNVSRIRFQKDYDAQFMVQEMGSKPFYDNMIFPLIATSSQPALSMENIRKFLVSVPSDFDEQQEIGRYFGKLDNLITLHQRKLEKLKNIKKSMLEKMFV